MKKLLKTSLLSLVLLAASLQAQAAPLDIKSIITTDKAWDQSALPGYTTGSSEMHVVKFKIAPGTKTPIHLHPVNGGGYIVSGELTMYSSSAANGDFSDPSKTKEIVLKQGDAWAEAVNVWHYGINNSDQDVEFIVVFAGQKGTPTAMSLGTYLEEQS